MLNPGALFQQLAGNNNKVLGVLRECWTIAQGIQKTRAGILDYINKNDAKVREMLPYLQQGSPVRSILDRTFPGMAPKIQQFGEELMREQESGQQRTSSMETQSQEPVLGNRFPALKQKR